MSPHLKYRRQRQSSWIDRHLHMSRTAVRAAWNSPLHLIPAIVADGDVRRMTPWMQRTSRPATGRTQRPRVRASELHRRARDGGRLLQSHDLG